MAKLVEAFQSICALFLQDIINLIHINDVKKRKFYKGPLAKELVETGYIKIENFLPEEKCNQLYKEIITLSETYKETTELKTGTYIDYRSSKTADGPDKGMLDIYHVNKTVEIKLDLEDIENILRQTTSCSIFHTSMHAYINRGVQGTRIFHVDNCQPVVYKGFIYLTDVDSADQGPYAFIKGTQRFSGIVYLNLVRNLFIKKYRIMDMPVFNKKNEVIGLGKKGTLILSNQNGIHRGYPQKPGQERVALVINYMLRSDLNYIHARAKRTIDQAIKKL